MFSLASHCLEFLLEDMQSSTQRFDTCVNSMLWTTHRLRTQCSGIGAVDEAAMMLQAAAEQLRKPPSLFQESAPKFTVQHMSATERSGPLRKFLKGRHFSESGHVFKDVLSMWTPADKEQIRHIRQTTPKAEVFAELAKFMLSPERSLVPRSQCENHPACACERPTADSDWTGSPCTDHSSLGNREGLAGETAPILLSVLRANMEDRVPVWVHENTQLFPSKEVAHAVRQANPAIQWVSLPLSSVLEHGNATVARNRRLDLFINTRLARVSGNIKETYHSLCEHVRSKTRVDWEDVLIDAHNSKELQYELANHKSKQAKEIVDIEAAAKGDWSEYLSRSELAQKPLYEDAWAMQAFAFEGLCCSMLIAV